MNVYETIAARKSVRSFLDKEVADEILLRILEAARLAPSARNFQEWRFVVVRDPAMRQRLAEAAKGQKQVAEAPVVVVCCAETNEHVMTCGQRCYPIDLAIAIDHITLCATAEGLGTCWIGAFHAEEVKKLLNIPPEVPVVSLLPLGYPRDPSIESKDRLTLEKIIRYERWT
ncbi:MAG: nitroreductase family protein [Deltaproteobacteria bacterium]|nr:nitroreductase family protein [Deltaproteobacteria bacterium]